MSAALPGLDLARTMLGCIAPERAHALAISALASGLVKVRRAPDPPELAVEAFGLRFPNPIGLAAGFDKDARAAGPLLDLGFGCVEVGTVTARPQPGNPRPRLFRLAEDAAIINRLGFNSRGLDFAEARLRDWRRRGAGPIGVNLGKNRDTVEAVRDYAEGARRLSDYADYLVVNVSSPNTPGLRALQGREELTRIVEAVRSDAGAAPPPVLVKIAPDLTEDDKEDIAAVALASRVDGLIISNTTVDRPAALRSPHRNEAGGLSGRPLFAPSTARLREMYELTEGRVPLIGVGGIESGAGAYEKIRNGASLIQIYTAFIFEGPALIARIKEELAACVRRDGFATLRDAVGADVSLIPPDRKR